MGLQACGYMKSLPHDSSKVYKAFNIPLVEAVAVTVAVALAVVIAVAVVIVAVES